MSKTICNSALNIPEKDSKRILKDLFFSGIRADKFLTENKILRAMEVVKINAITGFIRDGSVLGV